METVPRLYRRVRPQAGYRQSLSVLAFAAQCMVGQAVPPATLPTKSGLMVGQALSPANFLTKSGFMVGLGETESEVRELLRDLRGAGTDVATIGQYLQPTRRNLPVAAYIEPRQFDAYRDYGLSLGFKMVFSGPLVRSSYMADAVSGEALRQPC
jgi:lipoic acid synthetase